MPREAHDDRERLRAFFAVELGDGARRAAASRIEALRRAPGGDEVRWVRPEALHMTLRFLGDVERDRLRELVAEVAERVAPVAPFSLALGSVRGFPSRRRPRVVVLEVEPAEPLDRLAAAVERGVVAAGFPPEERSFRAHLTLGRLRGRGFDNFPDAVTDPVTGEGEVFQVAETVLFQSRLHRDGAQYTPLERMPLEGSSDQPQTPFKER